MPRIVALSDTHGTTCAVPDGDILIHAGDICSSGSRREFISGMKWLKSLPHAQKFFVPGNHDGFVENLRIEAEQVALDNGISLCIDQYCTVYGMRMYFSPWTPIFMNWAFMHDTERAASYWSRVDKCDILVTHGPPYGCLDKCPDSQGCRSLLLAVERIKPSLHIFGHIHECGGESGRVYWKSGNMEKTALLANVAVLDGNYRHFARPSVFDVESRVSVTQVSAAILK